MTTEERDQEIVAQAALGRRFEISRQRVEQILIEQGVTPAQRRAVKLDNQKPPLFKTCVKCGIRFESSKRKERKFCSRDCVPLPKRHYTKEQLVEAMQTLARKVGRTPTQKDILAHSPPQFSTFVRYFGTIQKAQEAAGLVPNKRGGPKGPRGPRKRSALR
jgi:hypothetical protein